jgi:hypothetical protein
VGRLEAFVSSVLLYNAEVVWPLRPEELKRLQSAYTDMVIQLVRKEVSFGGG